MVQRPLAIGSQNQHELADFTAHGADDRGPHTRWNVPPGISESGIRTQLMLGHIGITRPAPDTDELAPPAWDALCRLERMLRTRRDAMAARGRRSHAELLEAG